MTRRKLLTRGPTVALVAILEPRKALGLTPAKVKWRFENGQILTAEKLNELVAAINEERA